MIVDAEADHGQLPARRMPEIEDSFSDLIGLSVARGYTSAVQERFGRERGCSHLEFLARALGPVVIQALSASAARRFETGTDEGGVDGRGRHAVADQHLPHLGRGRHRQQKLAAGWRPAKGTYPAPSLVEIRRRAQERPGPGQRQSAV